MRRQGHRDIVSLASQVSRVYIESSGPQPNIYALSLWALDSIPYAPSTKQLIPEHMRVSKGGRMVKQLPLIVSIFTLLGTAHPQAIQDQHGATLVALTTKTLVEVSLNLQTSQQPLFAPYCKKSENDEESLCTARLEVRTPEGWRAASLKPDLAATLGGVITTQRRLISPGHGAMFNFVFSPDIFAITHGQRLRVVVDARAVEQSTGSGGQSIHLASTPFECP